MGRYKDQVSFVERKESSARLRAKYGGTMYPVVVEPANDKAPAIQKNKFMIPGELTIGQFVYIIRRRLVKMLPPTQAIFVYVRLTILPPTHTTIAHAYADYHDPDGILYIEYSLENTFG